MGIILSQIFRTTALQLIIKSIFKYWFLLEDSQIMTNSQQTGERRCLRYLAQIPGLNPEEVLPFNLVGS